MYTRCERIQYRGPGRDAYTGGHSVHSSENRCVNTGAAVPQLSPSLSRSRLSRNTTEERRRRTVLRWDVPLSISVDTLESSGRRRRLQRRTLSDRAMLNRPPPPVTSLRVRKTRQPGQIRFALADRYQAESHGSSRARSDLKFL